MTITNVSHREFDPLNKRSGSKIKGYNPNSRYTSLNERNQELIENLYNYEVNSRNDNFETNDFNLNFNEI